MYKLVEIVLAETVDKLIRMENCLRDLRTHEHEDCVNVIDFYLSVLESQKSQLIDTANLLYIKRDQGLTPEVNETLIRKVLKVFYSGILELHQGLDYLPNLKVRTETHIFIENLVKRNLVDIDFSTIKPSIVLINDYNFEVINISQRLYRGGVIDKNDQNRLIIQLPKIGKNDPLMWTILIHEIAHDLDSTHYKITDKTFKEILSNVHEPLLKSWTKEIVADLISIQMLGPSYILSIIFFNILLNNYNSYSREHPSMKFRLSLMCELLEKDEINKMHIDEFLHLLEERDNYDYFGPINYLEDIELEEGIRLENLFNDRLKEKLLDYIKKDIPRNNSAFTYEKSRALYASLKENIPIHSSWTLSRNQLADEYNSNISDGEKEIYSILSKFEDQSNDVASIVNAAWLYKIENTLSKFEDIFFKSNEPFAYKYEKYKEILTKNDEIIFNSIEISFIHWMIESTRESMEE